MSHRYGAMASDVIQIFNYATLICRRATPLDIEKKLLKVTRKLIVTYTITSSIVAIKIPLFIVWQFTFLKAVPHSDER